MLVLTRKIGEQVLIDEGSIQIKILKINDDVIHMGFSAPSHIDIDREEIYIKKLAKRNSSLGVKP